MEQHPIQLEHIGLSNIDFTGYRSGSPTDVVTDASVEVRFSYAPYDEANKRLVLMGEASIGRIIEDPTQQNIEKNPFYLNVRLHGFFSIDDDQFDVSHVNDFAGENAPFLMYPYLREHVHSLAIRCGYPNVTLPLVLIPQNKKPARQATIE